MQLLPPGNQSKWEPCYIPFENRASSRKWLKISSRYFYNSWRPVTAIRRTDIWLTSGTNVSDPTWTPLLTPTSNHQEYLSTHATFGGAAAAVIRHWNGDDAINVTQSSNVTLDSVGVITRRITSLSDAAKENGDSRVFGGVSLPYIPHLVLHECH